MSEVAFDTETRGLDWWDEDQQAFLGQVADAKREYVWPIPRDATEFVKRLDASRTVIAHNLSFDVHHTRAATGYDLIGTGKELHDTDIMSRVLYPEGQRKGERGGHGLKNLAKVFLEEDADKWQAAIEDLAGRIGTTLKTQGAYYDIWRAYPEEMEQYGRYDARYTFDLYQIFKAKLEADANAARCYGLEREVAPILINAEARGVQVKPERVDELHAEYTTKAEQLHGELERELGSEALGGAGSEAALLEALQKLGVPLHRRTPSGGLATNKFALQEFEDRFPVLKTLGEYRNATKMLSTYIEPMRGREVVHPSFMQVGAWTGRMSCRRPNMQNIPVRGEGTVLRSMFVPRPGYRLIVVDYDSIEVRLLAYYLGTAGVDYRRLIREGHDPHAYMASHIYGGRSEDYLKGTAGEKKRAIAKNTMFAITYGAGGPRVADMNKIKVTEARALIKKIKAGLPGYDRLMRRIRSKIEAAGYVTTLDGRKQPVQPDKSYVGLNALIQGSAAGIMKLGLVNAAGVLAAYGGHLLLVVHDELVAEVPAEAADEALPQVKRALEGAWELDPPLIATGTVVDNYAEAK